MGTSSSYSGPCKGSPLLPPWAEGDEHEGTQPYELEGPEDESPATEPESSPEKDGDQDTARRTTIDLSHARRRLRQYGASGDLGALVSAGKSYVRGMGGARNAARSARAGRRTTKKLGGFLSDLALGGVPVAFDRLHITPIVGRPVEEVLAAVQDFLAPDGSSIDEAAARNAMSATLRDIYRQYGLDEKGLDGLNAMDDEGVRSTLQLYVANYIYERMLNAMYNDLAGEDIDGEQLIRMERDIRAFTRETVKLELNDVDVLTVNWHGGQGDEVAMRIFEQAYTVWEAMRL